MSCAGPRTWNVESDRVSGPRVDAARETDRLTQRAAATSSPRYRGLQDMKKLVAALDAHTAKLTAGVDLLAASPASAHPKPLPNAKARGTPPRPPPQLEAMKSFAYVKVTRN